MTINQVKPTGGQADKIDFIVDAYSQLRISGLTVDPTPEDLELALMRMENMAAEWDSRTVDVNYNFEDQPDPNSPTNVIRAYHHAFATNLSARLIPDFNKVVPQALMDQATQSYSNMSGRVHLEKLQQVQNSPRMPRGSGNTNKYNRWARFYNTLVSTSDRTIDMFIGDVNDYTEHFDSYLMDTETISSYSIVADSGLTILSDAQVDADINYQLQADDANGSITKQVTIIITTSTGRIQTRITLFNLAPRD